MTPARNRLDEHETWIVIIAITTIVVWAWSVWGI